MLRHFKGQTFDSGSGCGSSAITQFQWLSSKLWTCLQLLKRCFRRFSSGLKHLGINYSHLHDGSPSSFHNRDFSPRHFGSNFTHHQSGPICQTQYRVRSIWKIIGANPKPNVAYSIFCHGEIVKEIFTWRNFILSEPSKTVQDLHHHPSFVLHA